MKKKVTMKSLLVFVFLSCLPYSFCISTHFDSHQYRIHNLTGDQNLAASGSDLNIQQELPHYVQPPHEYLRNFESLLAQNSNGNYHQDNDIHRDPHFPDHLDPQQTSGSHEVPNIRIFRLAPYQDQLYHDESDYGPMKKHDYGNNQNFGGWDSFQGGHNNNMGGNFGLGQIAGIGALKKGKEAKALFALMAPLILLAVFGPLLATQAMIPWVTHGGLTSVTTVAGGKRRKRQARIDPELEKRLQLFLEVQDFISRTGSREMVEEMGQAFLQCQKYTERKNKCLERVACEYTDDASHMNPEERRIGRMVLRNVMSNPSIPAPLVTRLKQGFVFGKNRPGRCAHFWCATVDSPNRKAK